jgi:hypothetical protein
LKTKRRYRTFKLLVVLLLALDLLAPAFLASKSEDKKSHAHENASLNVAGHQARLSLLIFEENSNEGKEESGSVRSIELCFTELFSGIQNLKNVEVPGKSPQEKFDTHPPLNLKHRVFQI